jgi:hypothetical protein
MNNLYNPTQYTLVRLVETVVTYNPRYTTLYTLVRLVETLMPYTTINTTQYTLVGLGGKSILYSYYIST